MFRAVTAQQYREELVRNAFNNGLLSSRIRQRLIESDTHPTNYLDSLDLTQKNADAY